MGSNLGGATSSEVCSKIANFFLLIEDYGYFKSRTNIGVSVDTKSVRETDSITDISDSITDISVSIILIFRYR